MQAQPVMSNPNLASNELGPKSADSNGEAAGVFESMLTQGCQEQVAQTPGRKASNEQEGPPETEQPEEAELDTPADNLILFAPAIFELKTLPPTALTTRALELTERIVSILEGYQSNPLNNTDIAPLTQELQQILAQLDLPQVPDFAKLADEVLARMPQAENVQNAENVQKYDKLLAFVESLRRDLCPPENGNGQILELPATDSPKTQQTALPQAVAAENPPANQAEAESAKAAAAKTTVAATPPEQTKANPQQPEQMSPLQTASPAPVAETTTLNQRTATVLPQAPVAPENLFDAMVERINQPLSEQPHLEIQLKPDHLGKLTVDLVLTENGLTAKILANDEGVRNLLASQINSLSQALADKGVKIESIDVAYAPLADQGFNRPQSQQQESHQRQAQGFFAVPGALESLTSFDFYGELSAYDSSLGLSSVEYRA